MVYQLHIDKEQQYNQLIKTLKDKVDLHIMSLIDRAGFYTVCQCQFEWKTYLLTWWYCWCYWCRCLIYSNSCLSSLATHHNLLQTYQCHCVTLVMTSWPWHDLWPLSHQSTVCLTSHQSLIIHHQIPAQPVTITMNTLMFYRISWSSTYLNKYTCAIFCRRPCTYFVDILPRPISSRFIIIVIWLPYVVVRPKPTMT